MQARAAGAGAFENFPSAGTTSTTLKGNVKDVISIKRHLVA
jgi:hypothetical protein